LVDNVLFARIMLTDDATADIPARLNLELVRMVPIWAFR